MNTGNQTILHIKSGSLAPKDMLEFILSKKPNAVGFMVQEADGSPLQIMQEDAANLELDTLENFQTEAKDCLKSLYFGNLKEGHHPQDVMPYVITDADNNNYIGIMLEGDILGNNEDRVHTEHYNYVNGVLIPKIVDWCEDFEGDIEKVLKKLNGDVFNKDFLASVGHRAVLHIMPFVGEPVLLGKNELAREFDWGWVSQAIGYGEAKAQEPEAVQPKKKLFGWGKKTSSITTDPNTGTHTINSDKKTLSLPKDTATRGADGPRSSVPAVEKTEKPLSEMMAVRPPSWLHKNDDIKMFYTILTGEVHPGWKKRLPIVPTQNLDFLKVANYDDYKQYRLEQLRQTTGGNTQTKQERLSSTAVPGPVSPPPLPEHGPTDPTPLPIIEPKELEKVLDYVTKHLDGNSKEMMPPHEIQKIEAELPKFTKQIGLKGLEETMNWPVSGLFGLAATDARSIVLHLLEWRAFARPYLQAELKAKKKDGVTMTTETTTTKLGDNTTKVESVVKKSGWGFKKNAA